MGVLRQEVDRLKSELNKCNSPIRLCHNDMVNRNIIYNEKDGKKTERRWEGYVCVCGKCVVDSSHIVCHPAPCIYGNIIASNFAPKPHNTTEFLWVFPTNPQILPKLLNMYDTVSYLDCMQCELGMRLG